MRIKEIPNASIAFGVLYTAYCSLHFCKEPVSSLIQTLLSVMELHHISHFVLALYTPEQKRVADSTAGRESHPAPKICYFVYVDYYSTKKLENQGVFGIF